MTESDAARAALEIQLEALPPVPRGGILRITHNANADLFGSLVDQVAEAVGHREFLIVAQRPGNTLEVLDEQAMYAAGWQRVPKDVPQDGGEAQPRLQPLVPDALAKYAEDPEQA